MIFWSKMKLAAWIAAGAMLLSSGQGAAAEPEPWVTHPFNGKNLDGWDAAKKGGGNLWRVGKAEVDPDNPRQLVVKEGGSDLVNVVARPLPGVVARPIQGTDLVSKARWGDCRIEIEVMVPKGANSGIYVMGRHEIQVLDGLNNRSAPKSNMGAIYGLHGPSYFPAEWRGHDWRDKDWIAWQKSDAYLECVSKVLKPPGQWQKFVIDFQVGKQDAATKQTTPAKFVRVELNGIVIHENVELTKPSGPGPLLLQGNHGPVAYRNIKITPLAGGNKEPVSGGTKP